MATRRARWRASTVLAGAIGAMFFCVWNAQAADIPTKAPAQADQLSTGPAVDGFNAKYDAFGGQLNHSSFWGTRGSWSVPFANSFGVQIDGAGGKFDSRPFEVVAGHFFWRNPNVGLLGLYGSFSNYNSGFGQSRVGQVAAEAGRYWGRFSVDGIAGVEFGNSISGTISGLIDTIDISTRFFDKVNVSFYPHDNVQLYVGHRYLGGKHAAAFGGEVAVPVPGTGAMTSLFAEGRAGEYTGVWGGLKIYLGQKDKTLIRRHREDDPVQWSPESIATIANQRSQTPLPQPPAPPPPDEGGGGD
jgi:hypothetical protein